MADSDKADSDKHCVVELVCPGTIPTLDLNGLLSKLYQVSYVTIKIKGIPLLVYES